MRTATIVRGPSSDQGTPGILTTDSGFKCVTGELPDRANLPMVSSIPLGKYICRKLPSPKFGNVYHVLDVEGRMDVLIHAGNFFGDKAKGFKSNVLGCILLGKEAVTMEGQQAITASRLTVADLDRDMKGADFELTIA